jgi:hypothetical protein
MKNEESFDDEVYGYKGELSPMVAQMAKRSEEVEQDEDKPWHQLEEETGQAYGAFRIYIDLGPGRSQRKVTRILYGQDGVSEHIKKWSKEHDWVNRSDAWDRFVSEAHQTSMERAVQKAEQHALRYLPKIVETQINGALGKENIGRTQARMIVDFLDRYGPAKQKSQTPLTMNQYNISAPALPQETTQNLMDVEDADFEVLEDEAQNFIPEDLRKKR